MARTRNVYPVDMVAHLWAHKAKNPPATAAISILMGTRFTAMASISQLPDTSKPQPRSVFHHPRLQRHYVGAQVDGAWRVNT